MARPKSPKKNTEVNQPISPNPESTVSNPAERPVERAATAIPVTDVTRTKTTRTPRNPEIVRGESRANLVPINLDDEIRRLAYLLSEQRGFEPGHETEDWVNAEREVLGRYEQQRA